MRHRISPRFEGSMVQTGIACFGMMARFHANKRPDQGGRSMADIEEVVATFKRLLDQVAAEATASIKSTARVVQSSPAPTSFEVILGKLTSRLDVGERAELIGLFKKMSRTSARALSPALYSSDSEPIKVPRRCVFR